MCSLQTLCQWEVPGHMYLFPFISAAGDTECMLIPIIEANLVAPILNEGGTREVYYTEGGWYHWFSNDYVEGKQFSVISMDMDDMPLYVKAGSIVPMTEAVDYISDETAAPLTICVYEKEEGKSSFIYYDKKEYEITAEFKGQEVVVNLGGLESEADVWLIRKSGTEKKQGVIGSCRFGV